MVAGERRGEGRQKTKYIGPVGTNAAQPDPVVLGTEPAACQGFEPVLNREGAAPL